MREFIVHDFPFSLGDIRIIKRDGRVSLESYGYSGWEDCPFYPNPTLRFCVAELRSAGFGPIGRDLSGAHCYTCK